MKNNQPKAATNKIAAQPIKVMQIIVFKIAIINLKIFLLS